VLNEGLRASVSLGIRIGRAWLIGARIGRVRNAVLVAIRVRTSVRLWIVGLQAGLIGTCIVLVVNAIAIGVGRASVGLRIAGLDTWYVDARVVVVVDAISVAVRWASVGLRIAGLDAWHIDARVLGIDHAIPVAVPGYWAAILLGIGIGGPLFFGASVVVVQDTVAVGVGVRYGGEQLEREQCTELGCPIRVRHARADSCPDAQPGDRGVVCTDQHFD